MGMNVLNILFLGFLNNNFNWFFKERLLEEMWVSILIRVVGNELFVVGRFLLRYFREFDGFWFFIGNRYIRFYSDFEWKWVSMFVFLLYWLELLNVVEERMVRLGMIVLRIYEVIG